MGTMLIAPRQARWFGPFVIAGGLLAVGVGIYTLLLPGDTSLLQRLAQAAVPTLVGALLATGGRMLSQQRGGVVSNDTAFRLHGDSSIDFIELKHAHIRAILAHEQVERFGEESRRTWVCEALLAGGMRVLLAESEDEHSLKHMAHRFCEAGGHGQPRSALPETLESDNPPDTLPTAIAQDGEDLLVHIGGGGALAHTLLAGGLAFVTVGVILWLDIANNNVFGFLFGPLFTALGLVLFAIPLVKRVMLERVRVLPASVAQRYEIFGRGWSERETPTNEESYLRIRQRGIHGACLEVVGHRRVIQLAGGVHVGAHLDPTQLFWLARTLQQALHR